MSPKLKIAPSLLSADFASLASEVRQVEEAGADLIHIDVMDGHFVKNITIGPVVVEAIRKGTKLPLDVHLMIKDPLRYAPDFLNAGADSITVHAEAIANEDAVRMNPKGYYLNLIDDVIINSDLFNDIKEVVQKQKRQLGLAINPLTPYETVAEVVKDVSMLLVMTVWPGYGGQKFIEDCVKKVELARKSFPDLDIEVDGGINDETYRRVTAAGANVLVAGTYVFKSDNYSRAIASLRQ